MRRTLLIPLLAFLAALMIPSDLFGQAQIYTRKEKLKDMTAKTAKVVLTGDEIFDEALKQAVTTSWTLSPYEFCSNEEFQKIKTDSKFYFLIVVKGQQRKESHAFGAKWHGQMIGTVSDFTSFSFHAVKNFTTAEGGALTWRPIRGIDDDELYRAFQLNSLHGQSKDALAKTQLSAWEYDVLTPAYKSNMTDITAAIGLVQLKRYPQMLARRRELIARYDEALKGLNVQVRDHYTSEYTSSGHLYQVRLLGKEAEERNEVINEMARREIACNVHFKPLPMMTAYKNLGFDIQDFPNAYNQFKNEITLPLHTRLTDEEVEYILKNFRDVIEH